MTSGYPSNVPLVSVIIPAFKVAQFIDETLKSVFAQTFRDFEVIVINDGSPDTDELEAQLKRFEGRVIYLKQANKGAGAARNAGLRVAQGEFVAFLDGDDMWLPEFLDHQLRLIKSGDGYDLVYADAVNFVDGVLSKSTNMDFNPSEGEVTPYSLITIRCSVITSSVVARRERILNVGLFDENFPNSQDFDLWLRLAKDGARITYQRTVLVHRRVYDGSLASNPINSLTGQIKVLEKTYRRTDLTTEERAAVEETLETCRATIAVFKGKQQLSNGDFTSALDAFRAAYAHSQSWKLRVVMMWLQTAPRSLQRFYKLRTT